MQQLYDLADDHRAKGSMSLTGRGVDFCRGLIALAINEAASAAASYAAVRWGSTSRAVAVTKAAVDALSTNTPGAVSDEGAADEFWAVVAQSSIIGRMSGFRRTPLHVRTLIAGSATAHWVGEGSMKPISGIAYTAATMAPMKVGAVTVATMEMLRDASFAAEQTIRADLMRACSEMLDGAFINPSNAGVADVTPASVTNGVTPISATASPDEDLLDLVDDFDGDLENSYLVMSPTVAVSLAGAARPSVGARGGTLLGIPVLTSRSMPAGVIALVDPTGIAVAEAEAIGRVITQGTVLMEDTGGGMAGVETGSPSGPIHAEQVSLWQTNTAALVAERTMNWQVVRPGSVSLITGAAYGAGSP